jgi:hypothetical protein
LIPHAASQGLLQLDIPATIFKVLKTVSILEKSRSRENDPVEPVSEETF